MGPWYFGRQSKSGWGDWRGFWIGNACLVGVELVFCGVCLVQDEGGKKYRVRVRREDGSEEEREDEDEREDAEECDEDAETADGDNELRCCCCCRNGSRVSGSVAVLRSARFRTSLACG